MNDKKTMLIQSAMKLFGERDYHTTSVQDIVNLAGVSKGAFYQHFPSKEELLFSIFNHHFERVHTELREAESNPHLTPRDLLIRGILVQCQLILENKNFLCMLVKGTAFTEKAISEVMTRESLEMARWFQKRIIELYGPDIEAHSMDCASMLHGCLKEYFFFFIFCNYPIDGTKLAGYLVERLDDLVEGIRRKRPTPILQSALEPLDQVYQTDKQRLESLTEHIELRIRSHQPDTQTAHTMLQTLETIVAELQKEQPSAIIIQGLYNYLLTLAKQDEQLIQLLKTAFDSRIPHHAG
ncbi:TetR/AcrR family transcriptional regulator [Paenibacillus xerothermodurans]|uniref:TetR/AcrR family transcriptional regulator n=1 Tax=Paenibacillus xerothermodurans TaxID=1977292 RepID=A0A2W1NPT2_PAEXE|nr:TetR/AcrR family transcriptional regulator [Paenibacillus xerothermodurans]PZE21505.1 TetR/AcrR family transcriptional regulator [Paenibacillus xerothermodurans]